jgi:hypothetical protein
MNVAKYLPKIKFQRYPRRQLTSAESTEIPTVSVQVADGAPEPAATADEGLPDPVVSDSEFCRSTFPNRILFARRRSLFYRCYEK